MAQQTSMWKWNPLFSFALRVFRNDSRRIIFRLLFEAKATHMLSRHAACYFVCVFMKIWSIIHDHIWRLMLFSPVVKKSREETSPTASVSLKCRANIISHDHLSQEEKFLISEEEEKKKWFEEKIFQFHSTHLENIFNGFEQTKFVVDWSDKIASYETRVTRKNYNGNFSWMKMFGRRRRRRRKCNFFTYLIFDLERRQRHRN